MKQKNKRALKGIFYLAIIFGISIAFKESLRMGLIFAGIFIVLRVLRIIQRGYFWKDKEGKKLTFKEFLKRFKEGAAGITPLQQTRTNLFSLIPIFGGLIWGAAVAFIGKTYWLGIILIASLPLTGMQFLSNLQKYWNFKKIEEAMKEAQEGE